jgi:hypothetical protein
LACRPEIRLRMHRLLAILVLCVGLVGAGTPALACATAAAAGDCCPPGAPADCLQIYEQADAAAVACCITAAAPSAMVAAEPSRELPVAQCDHGSADPITAVTSLFPILDRRDSQLATPVTSAARTDASLTYLHTARLRL